MILRKPLREARQPAWRKEDVIRRRERKEERVLRMSSQEDYPVHRRDRAQ